MNIISLLFFFLNPVAFLYKYISKSFTRWIYFKFILNLHSSQVLTLSLQILHCSLLHILAYAVIHSSQEKRRFKFTDTEKLPYSFSSQEVFFFLISNLLCVSLCWWEGHFESNLYIQADIWLTDDLFVKFYINSYVGTKQQRLVHFFFLHHVISFLLRP